MFIVALHCILLSIDTLYYFSYPPIYLQELWILKKDATIFLQFDFYSRVLKIGNIKKMAGSPQHPMRLQKRGPPVLHSEHEIFDRLHRFGWCAWRGASGCAPAEPGQQLGPAKRANHSGRHGERFHWFGTPINRSPSGCSWALLVKCLNYAIEICKINPLIQFRNLKPKLPFNMMSNFIIFLTFVAAILSLGTRTCSSAEPPWQIAR